MAPPAFCSPLGTLIFFPARPRRAPALSPRRPSMCARRPDGGARRPDDDARRDKRAVDSEWSGADSDLDMEMLAERAELLETKERQWGEIIETLGTLSAITRLPLLSATTNEPTAFAWLFVTACVVLPPVALFASAEWLQGVSVAFGRLF